MDNNKGVEKPPVGTEVSNIETGKSGEIVPSDSSAIRVQRKDVGYCDYFKYTVFWRDHEILGDAEDRKVVRATFR